jgi:hypothetical protein
MRNIPLELRNGSLSPLSLSLVDARPEFLYAHVKRGTRPVIP